MHHGCSNTHLSLLQNVPSDTQLRSTQDNSREPKGVPHLLLPLLKRMDTFAFGNVTGKVQTTAESLPDLCSQLPAVKCARV